MYINNGRINYNNEYGYRRGIYREPFYSDNADYNTNSKSYYDYLFLNYVIL